MSGTANIIITHQAPDCVQRMLDWWVQRVAADSIHLAYGGTRQNFDALTWPNKFFLESDRIRVRELQAGRQGYHEVFQKAAELGIPARHDFIHLAEYDQIPLQSNLNSLQNELLEKEAADVLGYRLGRVDHTSSAHYLYHWNDPAFREFLQRISVREDPGVVLSMMGFGSVWRAEAWSAVAALHEPTPIYLEIMMPTAAHHLGFRVRSIPAPSQFIQLGECGQLLDEARTFGAWNLHSAKKLWNALTI